MIKDGQVRELFRLLSTGRRLAFAARMTDMDEKTARKYRQAKQLPSQRATPRRWRTRLDPFEQVWPGIEQRLQEEPGLQAITLFRWLQGEQRGEFPDSQRRTFERRVRRWRATQGPNRPVMFAQVHHPGDLAASDFTHMDALGVTIAGQPFPHLVFHFTLRYSNWESVTVCPSESFEALSEGLQNALWELGGVPRRHRSDSFSAAVDQALRLRGSRDFASREAYLQFLGDLTGGRNAHRQPRFAEELAVLRPLPAGRLKSSQRLTDIRVGAGSTIQVLRNRYSVPSRLIGQKVDVVIGVEEVEVWHGDVLVQRMPRLLGRGKHAINYRHIIDSLVRKPGAFANYVYREELFPTSHFRMAYDALCRRHADKRAVREYLKILQLAARESQSAVEEALRGALARGEEVSFAAVQAAVQSSQQVPAVTEVQVEAPDLRGFDSLLDRQAESLRDGSFLDRRENLLVFGKPGSGKTHCVCALAERLVQRGRSLLFTTCALLVQSLLAAQRDLRLQKAIKQRSRFEGLILDDLGYVQHSREQMEVLFTLLAERYERGSVLLTSNLAFSQWEQIFKDAMTTAAAIDRLVHHCVIWELNVPSYRLATAQQNRRSSSPASPGPQEA